MQKKYLEIPYKQSDTLLNGETMVHPPHCANTSRTLVKFYHLFGHTGVDS
jgi:hypothetical protein